MQIQRQLGIGDDGADCGVGEYEAKQGSIMIARSMIRWQASLRAKGALSERQLVALKKMAARYAAQLPSYAARQEELRPPRSPKTKSEKRRTMPRWMIRM